MSDAASVAAAAAVLRRRHGLRFDGVGEDRLARGLDAVGLGAPAQADAALGAALDARPDLEAAVLDQVTLQETSFFRDPPVWDALRELLPSGPAVRGAGWVWSAGCANGQEAWSLAMLLDELGLPHVRVLATDLSPAAVARTRAGRYAERELRGLSPERRARYLEPDGDGFRVVDALRPRLEVHQHNAATAPTALGDGAAAAVVCRYVLIYLAPEGARALLAEADRVLAPGGRLVIGAAESLWQLSDGWRGEAHGEVLTYVAAPRRLVRTGGPATPTTPSAAGSSPTPPRSRARPAARGARRPRASRGGASSTATSIVRSAARLREEAEAAVARDDLASAERAYRAVAYLEPSDPLAHLGLAFVLERLADPGAARAFAAARAALARWPVGAPLGDVVGGLSREELGRLLDAKLGGLGSETPW